MSLEPSILYSFKQYPKQQRNECVANALAMLIEKLFDMRGETFEVDPNELDDKIRKHQNKLIDIDNNGSDSGVNSLGVLRMLRQYGYKNKLFGYYPVAKDIFTIRSELGNIYNTARKSGTPLYCTIKYGSRKSGTYTPGTKDHGVCCFGWDAESKCLLILDPQDTSKLYKCPLDVVKRIFRVWIRN